MRALAEHYPALKERVPAWEKILASIPAYRVNNQGAVKEWQDDRFEERYDHRHLSHIYPVFPGKEINSLHGKELLPAFEKAVRLREIDAQTSWSMAHMASIFARLEKGEDALGCLNKMARSCLTNSFFTLHNDWRGMNISWNMDPAPVQLDAIMGYVNAVQEMLIYSSNDLLKLLPGLPEELSAGEIKDFRYQDGSVNMRWNVEQGEFSATLTALRDHTVWLQLPKAFAAYKFAERRLLTKSSNGLYQLTLRGDDVCSIAAQR